MNRQTDKLGYGGVGCNNNNNSNNVGNAQYVNGVAGSNIQAERNVRKPCRDAEHNTNEDLRVATAKVDRFLDTNFN